MRACALRMIRLEMDDPHHRIFVERQIVRGGSYNHIIMMFDVGNEVVEYPDKTHTCSVDEAADIQEARNLAHTLATVEVLSWKNNRK